ncbi:SH3 domain-containing protein [Alkalibacterium sp. AK22]|uniref:SH3 domain-containing protein n=1 Tax=Alkalibacterium sp. AK22 TaxID=1229520 RepID=UPI0004B1A0F0|nr:SH3 domain-containing protein [Alkalibacterium sp. AK22]
MTNKWHARLLTLLSLSVLTLSGCPEEEPAQEESGQMEQEKQARSETVSESDETETQEKDADYDEGEESGEEVPEEDEVEAPVSSFGNQENVRYITADRLTIRSEGSAESVELGSLRKGNEVRITDEIKEEDLTWYQIEHHNLALNEGWVSSEFTTGDLNDLHQLTDFSDEERNDFFASPALFEDHTVVAYYGHPNSEIMGIVGRHPVEELLNLVTKTAETYDALLNDKKTIPAVYLVYGTVQPGGEVFKMDYDLALSYIEAAYERGILVYIDHQMGRHHPTYSIQEIQSFLRYPNVHLALDPEWRTERPMQEVGHITGTELNEVQEIMKAYIEDNEIQGTRQFVFHQFVEKMIRDVEAASSDFDPVLLVHNTSGWGTPEGKRATHDRVAEATNIPNKGFKLWYHFSDRPGVHYDRPLMTPEEVMDLDPQPGLIIYQ